MQRITSIAAALALAVSAMTFSAPARAGSEDAIIAGAAGFAIGTLFGSATARPYHRPAYRSSYYYPRAHYAPRPAYRVYRPWTRAWYNQCAARYRSFNWNTGYYVSYSGHRRFCY
jgi:hypothetical protein